MSPTVPSLQVEIMVLSARSSATGISLLLEGKRSLMAGKYAIAQVSTGTLNASRKDHTATLLSTGNVLIVGGSISTFSWEIYDSAGGLVSSGAPWATRWNHCAVALANGNVFIGGGAGSLGSWEIRNNAGGLVSTVTFWESRDFYFTCDRLLNGNIIIIGGQANLQNFEIRD